MKIDKNVLNRLDELERQAKASYFKGELRPSDFTVEERALIRRAADLIEYGRKEAERRNKLGITPDWWTGSFGMFQGKPLLATHKYKWHELSVLSKEQDLEIKKASDIMYNRRKELYGGYYYDDSF